MGFDNTLHIAFLLIVLLLVFGARRLPEIGRSVGAGMREFKDSISGQSAPMLSQTQQQPQPVAAHATVAQPAPVAPQAPVAQPAPSSVQAPAWQPSAQPAPPAAAPPAQEQAPVEQTPPD
jgi:sec-independent protein translocase protein TatA